MDLVSSLLLFIATGAVVGILAGLIGIGGGLVIVPILAFWFRSGGMPLPVALPLATGTSLAAVAGTCALAALAHRRGGTLDFSVMRPLVVPVMIGAFVGPWLATLAPIVLVQYGLVVLYVLVGLSLATRARAGPATPTAAAWFVALPIPARTLCAAGMSATVAAIAGIAGIGGNTLMIPLLARVVGVQFRQAMGVASALAVPLCLIGSLSYAAQNHGVASGNVMPGIVGSIYVPGFVGLAVGSALTVRTGIALGKKITTPMLERVFAGVLLVAALKLALTS
ncbi:MAG: sulfite exporter TauE/SafE family protein [Burkholderiales bacterium]